MTQESDDFKQQELTYPDLEPPIFPPPKQIGKYKVEALLTRSGMSAIYLGTHPETLEPVLIKVLLPHLISQPEFVRRFLNEAHIISLADHPNIVKLYDFGKWENGYYLAMEYVKGMPLRDILANQPFSLKRAQEVILQIAYAICHLHSQGIVHGDLKPENILINHQGQVKLIDFGIATTLTEKSNEIALQTPWLIGTPIYMSPEVHENPRNISFQSDIYALGIISFELALGKITHGKVILSLAPRGMQKILNKALQPRPEDRYADIVDFITDISNYIKSGQVQKDKQGSDYFFELFEQLETFQNKLLVQEAPHWIGMDIGMTHINGMGLNGLYYEFFDIDSSRKGICIAESFRKGAEGVIYTAMFVSCIHAYVKLLHETTAAEFIKEIERHLSKANLPIQFTYFEINNTAKTFQYFQSHYGLLMHWSRSKEKLYSFESTLSQISEVGNHRIIEGTWESQDRFFLMGYPIEELIDIITHEQKKAQLLINEAFLDTIAFNAQKQIDVILRKMRVKGEFVMDEHPLSMVCFCMD